MCDYTSMIPDVDLVASDNIYPNLVMSETYNVLHRDQHRWYYLSRMQPDELLVFKSFDSKNDGQIAPCTQHFPCYVP